MISRGPECGYSNQFPSGSEARHATKQCGLFRLESREKEFGTISERQNRTATKITSGHPASIY